MINVGVAGIGFMGWIHWLAYQSVPTAQVGAICEVDEKKRVGDWTGIQGNFGPPGEQVDLSGISTYSTLEEMLQDDSLDAVDLCLPPFAHADATVAALEAGKHVFVEKPMALTIEDCDRMLAAAEKSGKLLFVGHILPLLPEFAFVREAAAQGRYGKLIGGSFKRVISDPTWLPHFYDPDRIGGPLLDLHIHDAHLIRLLFGRPQAVTARGRMRGDVVEYFHSIFDFEDPELVVQATSGVIHQQGRAFTHAYEVQFEQATVLFDFATLDGEGRVAMPCTVLNAGGSVEQPKLGSGDPVDAFKLEIAEVVRCIEAGEPSELLGGDLARDAVALCHRETESVVQRATVPVA